LDAERVVASNDMSVGVAGRAIDDQHRQLRMTVGKHVHQRLRGSVVEVAGDECHAAFGCVLEDVTNRVGLCEHGARRQGLGQLVE
jgi:hypothetical protein